MEQLRMVPVRGKYALVAVDGVQYPIYRVNPSTPEEVGTSVPYDVGVALLCMTPTVVSVVPVVDASGAPVKQLKDADLERVREVALSNRPLSAPLKFSQPAGSDEMANRMRELEARQAKAEAHSAELLEKLASQQKEAANLREALAQAEAKAAKKAEKSKE